MANFNSKQMLKGVAWILGVALALLLAAYLTLLAINWHDQPPSESALRLAAVYRDRPKVSDVDNGFVYAMGFGVVPNADPYEAGARRVEWLRKLINQPQTEIFEDPLPSDDSYKSARSIAAQNIADACRTASSKCSAALEDDNDVLLEWTTSEKWLLDRYLTLLHHSGWLETAAFDLRMPLPPYSEVLDGQKLLLAQAFLLAGQKDSAGVRELLSTDIKFWRRVLTSADNLITKMIAVAALNRNFEIGNLVLRRLPAESQLAGMPLEWTTQLSNNERSLLRCFTGEWIFSDHLLRQMIASGSLSNVMTVNDSVVFSKQLLGRALMPMVQPQDSSNQRAAMFIRAAKAMDVPFDQLPSGLAQARVIFENPDGRGGPFARLYNPIGNTLLWATASAFAPYGARVTDLEGARRTAMLTTELRSWKVDAQNVPAELAASTIRDPYSNKAFTWDAEERAIVFIGLESSERGRHVFRY